ncbi:MAG: GNAT family N-acetyltransferase [Candidatus Hodarchaeales archaeon]
MSKIRPYRASDEEDWLECYFQAYTQSLYLDSLEEKRPRYETSSLELVYEQNNRLLGIIDVEIEDTPGQLCLDPERLSALVTILGVLPQVRRQGIATKLLKAVETLVQNDLEISRLEVWLRESLDVFALFRALGYNKMVGQDFYQVYYREDFFFRFNIPLPYGMTPHIFTGTLEPDGFEKLCHVFPPEKSYKIVILEKKLEES